MNAQFSDRTKSRFGPDSRKRRQSKERMQEVNRLEGLSNTKKEVGNEKNTKEMGEKRRSRKKAPLKETDIYLHVKNLQYVTDAVDFLKTAIGIAVGTVVVVVITTTTTSVGRCVEIDVLVIVVDVTQLMIKVKFHVDHRNLHPGILYIFS